MKPKTVALLCALILLALPAVARANATSSPSAAAREGSSFSANSVHKVVGNSADLTDAEAGGPFTSEQSTELLLLLGLGLIAGASLIGGKIGRSDSIEEVESSGQAALLSRPTRGFYGPGMPSAPRIPTTSTRVTAGIGRMRAQQLQHLSSKRMRDPG